MIERVNILLKTTKFKGLKDFLKRTLQKKREKGENLTKFHEKDSASIDNLIIFTLSEPALFW